MAETTDVARLVTRLEVSMAGYERAMTRAQRSANNSAAGVERRFGRMNQTLARSGQQLGRVLTRTFAAVAAIAAPAVLGRMVTNALSAAEAIGDLAARADVSTGFLQEMRVVTSQNGAETRDFDDAISRLNRRLGLFKQDGGGPAARAFAQLGLAARITNGEIGDAEDLFGAAVVAMQGVESQAERSALASQLFGEDSGPRLLQLMSLGTQAIGDQRAEYRRLGLVLSEEMVANAGAASDAFELMRMQFDTRINTAIASQADNLLALADAFGNVSSGAISAAGGVQGFLASFGTNLGSLIADLRGFSADAIPTAQETNSRLQALRDMLGDADTVRVGDVRAQLIGAFGNSDQANNFGQRGGISPYDQPSNIVGREGRQNLADAITRLIAIRLEREASTPAPVGETSPAAAAPASPVSPGRPANSALTIQREILSLQEQLNIEQARGESAGSRYLEHRLELLRAAQQYMSSGSTADEALANAAAYQRALDNARQIRAEEQAQVALLAQRMAGYEREEFLAGQLLDHEIAIARARGDNQAVRALERELAIRERIAVLTAQGGLSQEAARAMATEQVTAENLAGRQGEFREFFRSSFRDGILAALDGNAGEALSSWWREYVTRALSGVLDRMADTLFNSLLSAGGSGAGNAISSAVSAVFGGTRANGGDALPGRSYTVGENGPERFVPRSAGRIVPNGSPMPSASHASPPIVKLIVDEGAMFSARVEQISGPIAIQAGQVAYSRANADAARRAQVQNYRLR